MAVSGVCLRLTGTTLRTLQFLSSIIILGVFSYFLAELSKQNLSIATWIRAVEGISGVSALYTLSGFFLTCCLGGVTLFAFLAIVLDVCFMACFIAVAVLNKGGDTNCAGLTDEAALGNGNTGFGGNVSYAPSLSHACTLQKVVFILAIVNVFLFIMSAAVQLALGRHEQREKRVGTYTAPPRTPFARRRNATGATATGPSWAFWKRNRNANNDTEAGVQPLHEPTMSGSIVAAPGPAHNYARYGDEAPMLGENAGYYQNHPQNAY